MPYIGQRMSVNAYNAYLNDKRPWSKWDKRSILEQLGRGRAKEVERYNTLVLRRYFLIYSEWHHTSKYFNETDFFVVDSEKMISIDLLDDMQERYKEALKETRNKSSRRILKSGRL